jgi:hypothetical protein
MSFVGLVIVIIFPMTAVGLLRRAKPAAEVRTD